MTGVQLEQNQERRLELLIEIAPKIQRILVPYNPADAAATSAVEQISEVAPNSVSSWFWPKRSPATMSSCCGRTFRTGSTQSSLCLTAPSMHI